MLQREPDDPQHEQREEALVGHVRGRRDAGQQAPGRAPRPGSLILGSSSSSAALRPSAAPPRRPAPRRCAAWIHRGRDLHAEQAQALDPEPDGLGVLAVEGGSVACMAITPAFWAGVRACASSV